MAFCENCGAPVADDAKFCGNCGAKIEPLPGMTPTQSVHIEADKHAYQTDKRNNARNVVSDSGKKASPTVIIICIAAVLVAIILLVVLVIVPKIKSGKDDGDEMSITEQIKAGVESVTGEGKSGIKIPDGATIVTDAQFIDFIGEYEGQMQLTVLDGFEKIDGIPAEFADERKRVLSEPINCTFEIEDDGQWEIDFDLMSGMDFDTGDYDNPEEFSATDIEGMLITMPSEGQFNVKLDKEEEVNGEKFSMKMKNIGAYCEEGDKKLIAGKFSMGGHLYGADVTVEGDYVVYKTSGEFIDKETEEYETEDDWYYDDEEVETEEVTEAETESEEDISQGMHSAGTEKGGKWKQTGGGNWIYEKNGHKVKDSWIEDGGVYYYVDEDGNMLKDAVTPDGYYVGPDGAFDPDFGKSSAAGSSSDLSAIASKLSTNDIAYATDFEWFLDIILGDGDEAGIVVTDPTRASTFTDYQGLEGGWKAFSRNEDDDTERYFNAEISSDGNNFNITMNWKYLWIGTTGESVDETGSDLFKGKFNKNRGSATAESNFAKVDFDNFYVSADGKAQYAIGKFYWISGEVDDIALMRFIR